MYLQMHTYIHNAYIQLHVHVYTHIYVRADNHSYTFCPANNQHGWFQAEALPRTGRSASSRCAAPSEERRKDSAKAGAAAGDLTVRWLGGSSNVSIKYIHDAQIKDVAAPLRPRYTQTSAWIVWETTWKPMGSYEYSPIFLPQNRVSTHILTLNP